MATHSVMKSVPEVSVRLVREREIPYGDVVFKDAHTVVEFLREQAEDLDREHFFVLMFNARGKLAAFSIVSVGDLNSTGVTPREVFKVAILHNAAYIVVAHNHPSGDPTPSEDDFKITRELIEAGQILRIPVKDHIVIGAGSHTSFREYVPGFFYC